MRDDLILPPPPSPPEGETVFTGRRITIQKVQIDTEEGPVDRDLVLHPGSVVLLPITDDGRVVLIKNRRYAVGGDLLEVPAGTLEIGEDPYDAAGRELTEETGYTAARIERLGTFYPSPGTCTEQMHTWLATGLTAGEQSLDVGESITVVHFTLAEIADMMRRGAIHDGKTLAVLGLYFAQVGFPGA
ncbi:MAG: NUDIX hydrolase [Bradymonadia bacterium]